MISEGRTCSELTEFTCVNSKECIDIDFQCNDVPDCDDGSDEVWNYSVYWAYSI